MQLLIDLQMWTHEITQSGIPEQPFNMPCRAELVLRWILFSL